jgi:secondary thiamine-phosphate synthase enzyme
MTITRPATIEIETGSAQEVVDITERVGALLGGAPNGNCHLFLRHTTAGLMILTGEEGVPEDIMDILQALVPRRAYRHDSPEHVARARPERPGGASVHVPVQGGRLVLGEFQRIVLMEFEGPRRREIELRLLAEA